jgi:hypothetical protein
MGVAKQAFKTFLKIVINISSTAKDIAFALLRAEACWLLDRTAILQVSCSFCSVIAKC